MILADTWADFAGTVWADPTTRWIVYAALVVAIAIGGWRVWRRVQPVLVEMRDNLRVVKHEVKNDHKTNLRTEQDERHDENKGLLESIDGKVTGILRVLGEHGYRLDELEDEVSNTRDRRPAR